MAQHVSSYDTPADLVQRIAHATTLESAYCHGNKQSPKFFMFKYGYGIPGPPGLLGLPLDVGRGVFAGGRGVSVAGITVSVAGITVSVAGITVSVVGVKVDNAVDCNDVSIIVESTVAVADIVVVGVEVAGINENFPDTICPKSVPEKSNFSPSPNI